MLNPFVIESDLLKFDGVVPLVKSMLKSALDLVFCKFQCQHRMLLKLCVVH